MAKRKKDNKFYIYAPGKSGYYKGKRLMGVNYAYAGGIENLTVQDLIDFLKEKDVNPANVILPSGFKTSTKV